MELERGLTPAAEGVGSAAALPVDEQSRLDRLRQQYEAEQASGEVTGAIDAELIFDLLNAIRDFRARLVALEQQVNRAAIVDQLPANAPFGTLIRLRGDATGALYQGNGQNQPLSKLLPVAI